MEYEYDIISPVLRDAKEKGKRGEREKTSILNHRVNGRRTKIRGIITVLVKVTLETTSTNTITKALNYQRRRERRRRSMYELET